METLSWGLEGAARVDLIAKRGEYGIASGCIGSKSCGSFAALRTLSRMLAWKPLRMRYNLSIGWSYEVKVASDY